MKNEPVMIAQFVAAGAVVAALFGLELTDTQVAAISTVAIMVAGWIARAMVSPVTK